MQLDSYTLLVACCGLLILLGFAFVLVWLRDWQDDFVAITFGNAARITAVGCLWYGIRLFEGRRPPWGTVGLIAVGWIALCYLYQPFLENLTGRIVVVSLIMSSLCALAAYERLHLRCRAKR